MPDLLLELGSEEIPARFIDRAVPALRKAVADGLAAANLPAAEVRADGTPRRLAVWAGGLPGRQPDVTEEKQGPRRASAFEDGAPTVAAEKFAASMGLAVDQLETRLVKKGKKEAEYLFATREVPGRPAPEVLAELIPGWIEGIPFPKSMRWVPGSKKRFARPLRSIAALLDGEVIPVEWNGVSSGRAVVGHRFLVPEPVELEDASWEAYRAALEERRVVLERAERRRRIEEGLREHLAPADLERRGALVGEVANLVEWPLVDVGRFDERFLELPDVVVEEAMVDHQRYFPIPVEGRLAPRFAYVANRPFSEVIRAGNERVLAARLDDALFFYRLDRKRPLEERVDDLADVVFMQEVGSYRDRIDRVEALAVEVAAAAGWLAPDAGLAPEEQEEPTRQLGPEDLLGLNLHLAARIARADLLTEVVQEFPTLQGEMGAIYAREEEKHPDVCVAIREAYLPRGEGDALPETRCGTSLAVADKLDTIVCAFATGRKPTGSKDPFMVRRNTLGVLRILRERELDLGYAGLVEKAVALLPEGLGSDSVAAEVDAYFRGRLRQLARDETKAPDLVEAALEAGRDPTSVHDFWTRLAALRALAEDERFPRLRELVERSKNITDKNGPDVDPADVAPERLEHPAERALHEAVAGCRDAVRAAIVERRYVEAGRTYVDALADVTHTFFEPAPEGVFVMDDDPRLRTNRLALLKQVHALLSDGFADLSRVAG